MINFTEEDIEWLEENVKEETIVRKEGKMSDFDDLQNYAQGNWRKFDNAAPTVGIYRGNTVEEDPFGKKGEQRVVYHIEIDEQILDFPSKSMRLANKIVKVAPKDGDTISITRSGEGFKTDYNVEIVS